ncbi:MAG TPA: SPFH domain-containing protein [Anaerolineaceae bacterium]|nr:SPFH domain-containing protein [Anaerolineaceae bacterium]
MTLSPDPIPIAKVFSPQELHGWLKKAVTIPAGKTGVVIYHDGRQRLLPAGKHLVLNPFTRLRGDGIGMLAGFVPAQSFRLGARFENLLTGDDELLDAALVTEPIVNDPVEFFTRMVVPAGELKELQPAGTQALQHALENFFSRYEREDLLHRIPAETVNTEIYSSLRQLFPQMGLELNTLPQVFLKRSEDRLLVEDKLAEIENRVRKAPAALENQPLTSNPDASLDEDAPRLMNEKKPLSELLEDIHLFRNLEKAPRPHWILRSLHDPNMEGLSDKDKIAIRKYRGLEFRWLFVFLAIGAGITYLLFTSKLDLNTPELIGFTTTVWASIFSLIITRLKKIVEKQESLAFQSMGMVSGLDTPRFISQEEKLGLDKMVRQQAANELQHARSLLNESRERVFSAGNAALALRIKEFEKSLEMQVEKVSKSDSIAPHYLSSSPVKAADWSRILDQEEALLLQTKRMGKMAEKVRAQSPSLTSEDLDKLIQMAQALDDGLYARSRIV